MEIVQKITLDLSDVAVYRCCISAKQNDDLRKVQVTLTDHGQPYTIPSGTTAQIRCGKPDGHIAVGDATVSGNTVTASLTEQMLAAPGRVLADIVLKNGGKDLSTASFVILVDRIPGGKEMASTNEFLELELAHQESLEAAQQALDAAARAEAAADQLIIDTTLTASGQAADAKVTGDTLRTIQTCLVYSKNLFRPDEVIPEMAYDGKGGSAPDTRYNQTRRFLVPAGKTIFCSGQERGQESRTLIHACRDCCVFDKNGQFIEYRDVIANLPSGTNFNYTNNTADDVFVGFDIFSGQGTQFIVDDVMIELVDSIDDVLITPYVPFGVSVKTDETLTLEKVPADAAAAGRVRDKADILDSRFSSVIVPPNLYDSTKECKDCWLYGPYEEPRPEKGYTVSDYIPVNPHRCIIASVDGDTPGSRVLFSGFRAPSYIYDESRTFLKKTAKDTWFYYNDTDTLQYVRFNMGFANKPRWTHMMMQDVPYIDGKPGPFTPTFMEYGTARIDADSIEGGAKASGGLDRAGLKLRPADFFEDEIKTTVDTILRHTGKPCLILTWTTDTHDDPRREKYNNATIDTFTNVSAVTSKAATNGLVSTGDYVMSNQDWITLRDSDWIISRLRGYMMVSSDKVFMVDGNHDGPAGGTPQTRNYNCMATHNVDYVSRDGDNPYFYTDYTAQKVRLIFLDTNEWDAGVSHWGVGDKQLAWLKAVLASVENDWSVMMFSHIGPFDVESFKEHRAEVAAELNHFHAHSGSYASKTGKIIGWFVGHEHFDWIAPKKNTLCDFPVVVTTASCPIGWDPGPEYGYDGAHAPNRTVGTVTQDAWDTIIWKPDENKIYLIRFGAGEDRVIDLNTWGGDQK